MEDDHNGRRYTTALIHYTVNMTDCTGPVDPAPKRGPILPPSFDVQLSPMEIRTFELKVDHQ